MRNVAYVASKCAIVEAIGFRASHDNDVWTCGNVLMTHADKNGNMLRYDLATDDINIIVCCYPQAAKKRYNDNRIIGDWDEVVMIVDDGDEIIILPKSTYDKLPLSEIEDVAENWIDAAESFGELQTI